jgi:DNA-binding NtrC family response regulator
VKEYKILLVDDDPFILTAIGKDLEIEGYQVTTAESGEKAIEWLDKNSFDLVITDLVMEEIDGIQALKKVKEVNPKTMVIILTGHGNLTSAIDALRLNADDYLLKPCEPEEMFFRVSRCLEKLEFQRKIKLYEKILPVCCQCKKIRDDRGKEPGTGTWIPVEKYIYDNAHLEITSTYCPECVQKVMEVLDSL